MWRGLPAVDGGVFDNIPDPTGDRFGVLSLQSLRETFMRPSLRTAEGHFICRDPDAPITQARGKESRTGHICAFMSQCRQ